ncbi:hypothetical protein [Amycolatopsis sp. NPDC059657]|uniref:TRAFAC clade GTPase domain-containing protein n=1 Tax=Amycolatopsis sp. NPDC059657 TaxID=3346899 RepID=UPI003671D8DA
MSVVILLALLGAGLLAAVFVYRRRKGRKPKAASAAAALDVPKFRVVTLGLQGSGKTLLLTSMYRRLQVPGGRGFHVKAPYEQFIELSRWYRQIADDGEWPEGTTRGEMREFEFSVMTDVGDDTKPVVKIGYLEYPGELLTDPDVAGSTAQARLLESIGKADALIGIIDGLRVLQAYQGDRRGMAILQVTLDAMINAMLESRKPIAFVITKWDLLDQLHADENTRLHIVRTLLMSIPGFRDLVRVQSTRRVIRLIPVTAVGHDFAVLDGGQVRKKATGKLEPAHVDMALSAVVPDILRQVELSLDRETREAIMTEARRRTKMGPAEALQTLAEFVATRAGKMLLSTAGGGLLADSGLALFLDSHFDDGGRKATALNEADRRADEHILARRRVVSELQQQVAVLEAKLPSSRLGD